MDVAKRLGRYQSYVTNIETGQRRIDVVELVELAERSASIRGRQLRAYEEASKGIIALLLPR